MQMSTVKSLKQEVFSPDRVDLRALMRLLPSDVRAIHLLPEDPDYTDEEDEVHLPGGSKPLGSRDLVMRGGV